MTKQEDSSFQEPEPEQIQSPSPYTDETKQLTRDNRSAILSALADEMREDLDEGDNYSDDDDFQAEDDPEDKSIRMLRLAEMRKIVHERDDKMITTYL